MYTSIHPFANLAAVREYPASRGVRKAILVNMTLLSRS